MYKKAASAIRQERDSRGISSDQVFQPKSVTHFHINAIEDQVEYKLYRPEELRNLESSLHFATTQ